MSKKNNRKGINDLSAAPQKQQVPEFKKVQIMEPNPADFMPQGASNPAEMFITRDAYVEPITNADTEEAFEMAAASPSPIFYDGGKNIILNAPNPFDIVIRNLALEVRALFGDTIINTAYMHADKHFMSDMKWKIRNVCNDVITSAYANAIHNAVLSFFTVRFADTLYDTFRLSFVDQMVSSLLDQSRLNGWLSSVIDNRLQVNNAVKTKNMTVEDGNSITLYHLFLTRDQIVAAIAAGLNEIIRSMSFGKTFDPNNGSYYNNTPFVNVPVVARKTRERAYDDLMRANKFPSTSENACVSTEWFWMLSCEASIQIEAIGPMIEALLWQVVTATDQLYPEEIIKMLYGRDYRDPYDDDDYDY